MAAPWNWIAQAKVVFEAKLGKELALEVISELRKIPTSNGSLKVTLERLEEVMRQ